MYFFPSSIEAEIVKIIAMNTRKNIFFLCLNVSCYKSTRPIRHMHVNSYSCTYTRTQPPFTHTRRIKNLSAIKNKFEVIIASFCSNLIFCVCCLIRKAYSNANFSLYLKISGDTILIYAVFKRQTLLYKCKVEVNSIFIVYFFLLFWRKAVNARIHWSTWAHTQIKVHISLDISLWYMQGSTLDMMFLYS